MFFYIGLLEIEHRNNVNLSPFIQLAKVQQQNESKKKPGLWKETPVTGSYKFFKILNNVKNFG